MWHLISTVRAQIRNVWLWSQRNPFLTVLVLHVLFLTACCLRYVSSMTIQLHRKRSAVTVVTNVRSSSSTVHQKSSSGLPGAPALSLKKEPIKNNKKLTKKVKKQPEKKPQKVEKPALKKIEKLIPEKKKVVEPKAKKEPEQKVVQPVQQPTQAVPVSVPAIPEELQISAQTGELATHVQMTPGEVLHVRVLETWKPPRNVRPKLPCVLRVIVGKGALETKPEVVSSSGSSAFDMSARRALLEIKYPPELWNRAITIHFS